MCHGGFITFPTLLSVVITVKTSPHGTREAYQYVKYASYVDSYDAPLFCNYRDNNIPPASYRQAGIHITLVWHVKSIIIQIALYTVYTHVGNRCMYVMPVI